MLDINSFGRFIIGLGIILIILGGVMIIGSRVGLGRLPGDIYIKRENMVFYFPVVTSIFISLVLSVLFYFLKR